MYAKQKNLRREVSLFEIIHVPKFTFPIYVPKFTTAPAKYELTLKHELGQELDHEL